MCAAAEAQLAAAIAPEAAAAGNPNPALAPSWGAASGFGAAGAVAPGGRVGGEQLLPGAPPPGELVGTAAAVQALLVAGRRGEALRCALRLP